MFTVFCSMLLFCWGFATQSIDPNEEAQKYHDADLVIIGNVIAYTTKTIQEKDLPGSGGRVYHYTTLIDIYRIQIDSVLKGSFADSTIVIQSKPFVRSETRRTKFLKVDEKGDSIFQTETIFDDRGEGVGRMYRPRKYIILIEKQDTAYIYVSSLSKPYREKSGKIAGKVVDGDTEGPIPFVNVIIVGTTMGAATNKDGHYFIINVPVGRYDIQASMIGYELATERDVTVFARATSVVDFTLNPVLINVIGGVEAPEPRDSTGDAYLLVLETPGVPMVMINGIQVHRLTSSPIGWYFNRNFPIFAGDSAKLRLAYKKPLGNPGAAQTNIMVPGQFSFMSHDTSSIAAIPAGEDLTITWSSSDGADAYLINFYLEYSYTDTVGKYEWFSYSLDTLSANTAITFPTSKLFPNVDAISRIVYSYGDFDISAMAGPWQEGAEGNVTHDGVGFFYGWTYGGGFSIVVDGSKYLAWEREKPENRLQKFLEEKAKKVDFYYIIAD